MEENALQKRARGELSDRPGEHGQHACRATRYKSGINQYMPRNGRKRRFRKPPTLTLPLEAVN